MDLSGIIFVVLAVAWAGYLIPKALKHHDEVARTRSVDRFSNAMRVLARREPVNRRDARLVVTPARSQDNPRVVAPSRPAAPASTPARSTRSAQPAQPVRTPARRAAARAAARRRRRILSFLLLCDLVVGVLSSVALVPRWSAAVPAGLTVLYLVLCRTQVRHENQSSWDRELAEAIDGEEPAETGARRAARVDAPYGTPVGVTAARNDQGFEEFSPNEETLTIPAVLDVVAVPTVDGGSLWDPLPMTLPTYVSKPKAKRTVRTIDLNEPGAWTSGRTEADSRLVQDAEAQAAAETAEAESAEVEQQRAVGS
ncbi:MAG: divisome protein SepX/GlpR [Nocardioidaceae bacterium]